MVQWSALRTVPVPSIGRCLAYVMSRCRVSMRASRAASAVLTTSLLPAVSPAV